MPEPNHNIRRGTPLQPRKYYHILNRGNNKEDIFVEERNYPYFLHLYERYVSPHVSTYAYCLMRNHFHLLICANEKESDSSLQLAFQSLFGTYAKAINKAYNRTGKLFQEHFARIEVNSENYFTNLIFYIHFNPQKHGFVGDFRDWYWSSYKACLSHKMTRVMRDEVLAWFGGRDRFIAFHQGVVDERNIAALIDQDRMQVAGMSSRTP